MPCETEEFRKRMEVWHPAYPTLEYGRLVFVYMGPPGTQPLSRCTTLSTPGTATMSCCAASAYRASIPSALSKTAIGCSTTRTLSIHCISMLHQMISGRQFEGALTQGAPQIGFGEHRPRRPLPGSQGSPERQSLCAS